MSLAIKNPNNLKFLLILFSLFFVIFVFTSDGHRFTFDEDVAAQQSKRIATLSPDPTYVEGESRLFFEYPWLFPPEHNERQICQNAILCSQGMIMHSLTEAPFIFINHNFGIITAGELWTLEDFEDFHYITWRNSIDPDVTFMELFYAPFFSALSICALFLISKTYGYSVKTSLILVFLFSLSTTFWAYTQTSLNVVPFIFFILIGFFFYRKFQETNSHFNLILTAIFFGLGFLTRQDAILFIIPFFVFILITSFRKNPKLKTFVKTFLSFVIPAVSSYVITQIIRHVRVGDIPEGSRPPVMVIATDIAIGATNEPILERMFGLLFSPGAGLFIYAPILFTCFVGFFDFYKKNKSECILLIVLVLMFIFQFARGDYWHGFSGWSVRYFLPLVPFFMIPIAFSLENRGIVFKLTLIILGVLGFFINLVYILQDVHWFVWGLVGDDSRGLYSFARKEDGGVWPIWVNPLIIWSFEYNQLTQSVMWIFGKLQVDLFLLKLLGIQTYIIALLSLLAIPIYLLRNIYYKTKLEKSL